jgi:hypothetical protein
MQHAGVRQKLEIVPQHDVARHEPGFGSGQGRE